MRPLRSALLAAAFTGFAFGAPDVEQQPVFRTMVDLVRIDALVTVGGKPVAGLGPADFEVVDNGVLQVVQIAEANGRLNVILALDVSGSVTGGRFSALLDGVRALLSEVRAGEQVALLTFNAGVALRSPLATDVAPVRRVLQWIQPDGTTSMNDAVFSALSLAPADARSLLLLFSDGVDNSSWLSGSQVIESARRADIVVCPVVVGRPRPWHERFLEALADRTGGRLFRTESIRTLRASMIEVLTEFRSRYVIAYMPTGVSRDDGWHHVEVRLKGRRADVKAKDGYLAHSER
jgi:VWFA-related protein